MQKGWLWSLALLLLFAQPLVAQDEKQDQKAEDQETEEAQTEQTLEEQLNDLTTEYRRASSRFSREMRAAEDDEARAALMEERTEFMKEIEARVEEIHEAAKGTEDEVKVLVWMITNRMGGDPAEITETILDKHIDSPDLVEFASRGVAGGMPSEKTENNIRTLYEKNPHDEVKGTALMTLINYFSTLERYAGLDEEVKATLVERMGEGGAEYLDKWTADAIAAEMEKLLEEAIANYSDVPYGRKTVGEYAEGQLFVIKYLGIGKVAPDIEGEDLDGEEFALSDYRGKVVVIDFWGDW